MKEINLVLNNSENEVLTELEELKGIQQGFVNSARVIETDRSNLPISVQEQTKILEALTQIKVEISKTIELISTIPTQREEKRHTFSESVEFDCERIAKHLAIITNIFTNMTPEGLDEHQSLLKQALAMGKRIENTKQLVKQQANLKNLSKTVQKISRNKKIPQELEGLLSKLKEWL